MTSPAHLVQQLHDIVEQLLALPDAAFEADEAQDFLVAMQRERDRLAVAAADALAPWESSRVWEADGSLRASLALGRDAHCDHRQAANELRRARLLTRMPHTRAAVVVGRLSMDHVDLFVRHCGGVRFELFLQHEATLVDTCAGMPLFDDARRAVLYWAALADDELGRAPRSPRPSALYQSRDHDSGELSLVGRLEAVDGEIVANELARLMRDVAADDRRNGTRRTTAERRAAALVRMATRSSGATGVPARPLIEVIVGVETAARLCQLASGTVVAPEQLAGLLDSAMLEAFLFDGTHTVLGVSRRRTFTGALRRAIKVRDLRCQHPSVCPTPAAECDIDHRTPAARGGQTSQFNGRPECTPHNRLPHLHDHDAQGPPERDITWLEGLRARLRFMHLRDLEIDDDAAFEPPIS